MKSLSRVSASAVVVAHAPPSGGRRGRGGVAATIASPVRWASAMIVIIGFVPEGVGNALASPIHTPGVSCSSPYGFGHARLRVGAHPAGAHLVRGEQPEAAGAQRHALEPLDVAPPRRRRRATRACPAASAAIRRAPAATCRRTWASSARWVLRTSSGSSSEYQGTAWPASSIVTRPAPWSRTSPMNVAPRRQLAHRLLVLGARHERRRRGARCRSRTAWTRSGSRSRPRRRRTRRRGRPAARPTRRACPSRTGRRRRCTGAGAGSARRPGRRCRCAAAAPGDSSAPQATTTRGARTVTRALRPLSGSA